MPGTDILFALSALENLLLQGYLPFTSENQKFWLENQN